MTTNAREFSHRLTHCLDETGAPAQTRDRAILLSKLLDIPKHLAFSILEGHLVPDNDLVLKIANEFEVEPKWLTGEK